MVGTGHQNRSAFTMKSSGFFPFVVLLALGILASWSVEGGKSGELELLWSKTAWSVRQGLLMVWGVFPSVGCFSVYSGPPEGICVLLGSEVSVRLQGIEMLL